MIVGRTTARVRAGTKSIAAATLTARNRRSRFRIHGMYSLSAHACQSI
jgi:hypothetical protein